MRAAYYERNGTAREVLQVGEVDTPQAGPRRGAGQARGLRRQSVRRQIAPGLDPQDRLAARHPAQRRRRRHRRRSATACRSRASASASGSGTGNGSGLRHRGRIHRAAGGAGGKLPDNVSFEAGACLGIPAMTAYHAVALGRCAKGTTLLVAGGAGSVSQYVIQFAKMAGATRDHDHFLAAKRPRSRARPAPTTPSTTSARMSANG